jgi:hypothetical protein
LLNAGVDIVEDLAAAPKKRDGFLQRSISILVRSLSH